MSAIIFHANGWDTALESLSPSLMTNADCRFVFEACISLHAKGLDIQSETIVHELGGYETKWPGLLSRWHGADYNSAPMLCVREIKTSAMKAEIAKTAQSVADAVDEDCQDIIVSGLEALQAKISSLATGSGSVFDIVASAASIAAWSKTAHDTGFRSGIECVDALYRPARGLLTVVTGSPGSGKSEMLDALMCRYAMSHKLRFAIYSPENFPPAMHAVKLADKMLSLNPKNTMRATTHEMAVEMVEKTMERLGAFFSLIDLSEGDNTLDALIDTLDKNWEELKHPDGFVIDPWNELEATLRPGERETDYIGRCLARLRRWARKRNVILWVVAHPTKLKKDDEGNYIVPTPYDISGSANWYNKADNAITVSRKGNSRYVELHVQKIKQKIHGQRGIADLVYDNKTGMYYDRKYCPEEIEREAEIFNTQEAF